MRPENPRKSSTSSARRQRARARYLGVEVAGEPVPPTASRLWQAWLHRALEEAGAPELAFRIVRSDGPRAIVEVALPDARTARLAWNSGSVVPGRGRLCTARTWGTLIGAKAWAARRGRSDPERASG
jgi:hypothetical protein